MAFNFTFNTFPLHFWLDNHQDSFPHWFNSFINIFSKSVFESVFDSYRNLFKCFMAYIFFSKAWVRSLLLTQLKSFSIGLKSVELEGMLNLITATVSEDCLAFYCFIQDIYLEETFGFLESCIKWKFFESAFWWNLRTCLH